MTRLFHTLCFTGFTFAANLWPAGGLHQVTEDCWCGPDLEISSEADAIVVRHRCDSTHASPHHWLAIAVGELPLDGEGFIQIPGTGE